MHQASEITQIHAAVHHQGRGVESIVRAVFPFRLTASQINRMQHAAIVGDVDRSVANDRCGFERGCLRFIAGLIGPAQFE